MINIQETVFDLAYKGDLEKIRSKVRDNPDIVTQKDGNERLLIHWAALAGCEPLVKFLIDQESPVDPADDIGMTPLILASSANRVTTVKLLLEKGADVNAQNHEGHSPVQYAASKGWKQVLEILLKNNANINITDKRKATPLHRAASKGDPSIVSLFLKYGTGDLDFNPIDAYGNTPLHLACEENNVQMAELLIQNGAKTDIQNKDKLTPLHLAAPAARKALINLLNNEDQ